MFILSALVFFSYIFAFSWLRIRRNWSKTRSGLFRMLGDAPETFLLALFSFMAIWLVGGFFIFHAYLIALNQVWFQSSFFFIQIVNIKIIKYYCYIKNFNVRNYNHITTNQIYDTYIFNTTKSLDPKTIVISFPFTRIAMTEN